MLRTGIIIVAHNSQDHLGACLAALERYKRPQDVTLVIDNASEECLSAPPPPVRFLRNSENRGFAGAANQGFAALENEVGAVLLLNPDVVLTASLEPLLEACLQHGVAGGCLTDSQGNPQVGFSFRAFPTPWTLFFETVGLNKFWKSNPVNRRYRCLGHDHSAPQFVDQPAGAMVIIRKDVWRNLGGFDERFHPVWFEDVDFCQRAAVAGFKAAYVPSVSGVHAGGHSVLQLPNSNRRRYWYASLMRYSRKHFGSAGLGLVAGGVLAAAVARAFSVVLRLHDGFLKEAAMNLDIARLALVYPNAHPPHGEAAPLGSTGVAQPSVRDGGSSVLNEGTPSKENTERTLKRLHAR